MTPRLIPFESWHLTAFINRETQKPDIPGYLIGPAYTAILDDRILGCAGIVPIPQLNIAVGWASFTEEMFHHRIWISRTVRNVLRDYLQAFPVDRIEALVPVNSERNKRWAIFLGFDEQQSFTRFTRKR